MNTGLQISFQISVFVLFRCLPRSDIAGPYGSCIFNFLRNLHTVFHSGCTNLHSHQQYTNVPFSPHSHQQCVRVPISPHPCQQLLLSVFLIITMLMDMKWHFTVVLICISLMANDVDPLLKCLFDICISSLEKCLFRSFAHFKIELSFYY